MCVQSVLWSIFCRFIRMLRRNFRICIAVWKSTDKDDYLITPLLDLICLVLLCYCFCKDETK